MLKKYQQYILGFLASLSLLLIGLAILAISLFKENRHQAASIQEFTPSILEIYQGE